MSADTSARSSGATSRVGRPRPARGWVGLVLGLLLGAGLLTWANLDRAGSLDPLHPENPREDGARAVARVLADRGVEVTVVESRSALERSTVDGGTTLVVTGAGELGTSTYSSLADVVDEAGTTVLVAPMPGALEGLDLPFTPGSPVGGELEAGCDLPVVSGLVVDAAGPTYRPDGGDGGDTATCFRSGTGAELPGLLARSGTVHVLGGSSLLTNDRVDEADNAAVALRLLGQHPRLVWYVPTADDLAVGDVRADAGALEDVLPRWLVPALLLLGAAATTALLWQGRRFGPLVVEPLPVEVRADETEASRGRLYRQARDPQHAADTLRAEARARWREHLGLPASAPVPALAERVAAHVGGPEPAEVLALLADGPVGDDGSLVRLAAGLARLDPPAEPRRPTRRTTEGTA